MLVAFATDQRKVDDWPRSTEAGSATNVSMRGGWGLGGGGGGASTGGGGGGGAAATFFLHPEAATNNAAANTAALSVLLFIRILNILMPSSEFRFLTNCGLFDSLGPHGLDIIALC